MNTLQPGAEGKFHFLVLRSESRSQLLFSGKESFAEDMGMLEA